MKNKWMLMAISVCTGLQVNAKNPISTGFCGNGCTYELYDDGHAVVSGTGTLDGLQNLNNVISITVKGFSSVTGFKNNKTLKEVILTDSVTSIGDNAFYKSAVETVIFSDTLTSIGNAAFRESKIASVTFPDTLSYASIGTNAFWGTPIKSIYCSTETQSKCVKFAKQYSASSNTKEEYVGSYKTGVKYISYYDKNGKLVMKKDNPNYSPKKIYTIEEATQVVSEKGKNIFSIKYR